MDENENVTNGASEKRAKSPKRRRKVGVIVGVVVVVLVVAGAGLWTWHEQPSFCGAICHTPMDNYLETYEAEPGQPAADKWGNEVADASGMMAPLHRADAGTDCLDCHTPVLSQQISEGVNWVSGNYQFPLNERTLTQITEPAGIDYDQLCLNESCHNMTREDLVDATADMGTYNPHSMHHEELDCGTCHKAHRASVMYCTQCHATAEVPEGWVSMAESNAMTDMPSADDSADSVAERAE